MSQVAIPGLTPHAPTPTPFPGTPPLSAPASWSLCASGPVSRSDSLQASLPPSSTQLKCCLPTCPVGKNALHPLTPVFSALCPEHLGPLLLSLSPVTLCGLVPFWIHLQILREPSPSLATWALNGSKVVCLGSLGENSF